MQWFSRKRIYLDWAASAPVLTAARAAFMRALGEFGNPSSLHADGRAAKDVLAQARTTIARLAEVKPDGVVFTSGATEANNLALTGFALFLRKQGIPAKEIHILYLPSAHASIIKTVEQLAGDGMRVEPLILAEGAIDIKALAAQLTSTTRLVAIDGVCGETGLRFDTRAVRRTLDEYANQHRTPRIALHVDASQMPLVASFSLTHLGADMIALDAQKVGGVRGMGALCSRSHVTLSPLFHGGEQEHSLRPGTEPVALTAAFAVALEVGARDRDLFVARATRTRAEVFGMLVKELPDMLLNEGKEQAPHILNLSFLGRDTDYLVMLLDREGASVSTKSACENDSAHGSRAVLAFTGDTGRAEATLRVSWGPRTSGRELRRFAHILIRAIRFMDASSVYYGHTPR